MRLRAFISPILCSLALVSTPAGAGPENLKALIERAAETETDALLIQRNGQIVYEKYSQGFSAPIETFSVTKSLVSLAVGFLVDEGKLSSLDTPVHRWFPEWRTGTKSRITVRHLLNHTSGLGTEYAHFPPVDLIEDALATDLVFEPGSDFEYNNRATHLLSGVVARIAGMRTDLYLREKLFQPLGITRYGWLRDQAGNAYGSMGFQAHARDLAKIGELLLNRGKWNGRRLLSESWLRLSFAPSQDFEPHCGLLWWLIGDGGRQGFNAAGHLGQYLVVIPETRTVGVRLHRERSSDDPDAVGFYDFADRVAEL